MTVSPVLKYSTSRSYVYNKYVLRWSRDSRLFALQPQSIHQLLPNTHSLCQVFSIVYITQHNADLKLTQQLQ